MNATKNGNKEIVELLFRQEKIDVNIKNILNQKYSYDLKLNFELD